MSGRVEWFIFVIGRKTEFLYICNVSVLYESLTNVSEFYCKKEMVYFQ